ncbi:MAG: TIGR02206 family membrane protein [Akkermansiaceae bacterium]|nr:TIGR02206 family membrane protein [Akkermansiaceae bacterium]
MSHHYYPFIRWSTEHIVALVITVVIAVLLLYFGTKCKEKGRLLICRFLAIIVAIQFISEFAWRAVSGAYGSWQYNLPLHFCSFMSIFAFIALWWRWRPACTLVYFGVLVGSIQGLITPAMANGYPDIAFFVFFIAHGLLLIVALSIPILQGWRARGYDDVVALLLMDAYVLFIIPINIWLNTNYGYTQGVPVKGTLLDYLGEAPWYYVWAQLPVLAVFRLLMLPVHDKNEE